MPKHIIVVDDDKEAKRLQFLAGAAENAMGEQNSSVRLLRPVNA